MNNAINDQMLSLAVLGKVTAGRTEVKDDFWGDSIATIELNAALLTADATLGLDTFSHVEIIFIMDQVNPDKIVSGARHPRNDPQLPLVGILAQRGKSRPNCIGLSRAKLLKVDGLTLTVQGLDAVVGSPILDVKPYVRQFVPDPSTVKQPSWLDEIMQDYYKPAAKNA